MNENKHSSKLKDHKFEKKKGLISSPFNAALGDRLVLSSWAKERMPEYLWLGLILLKYGRDIGIEKAGKILFELSKNFEDISYPKYSLITNLPDLDQKKIYKIILTHIDKDTLAPLTIFNINEKQSLFNDCFFVPNFTVDQKIKILSGAIKVFSPHQTNEATDLRFLSICLLLFKRKIFFTQNTSDSIEALREYPYTKHEDDKMHLYRPIIRSIEGGMRFDDQKTEFPEKFWRDIGMITPCSPMKIRYKKSKKEYTQIISDYRKILEYIVSKDKEKLLNDDKFLVITGSIDYALKIFEEIIRNNLANCILGRHGLRTIVEIHIMMKYLLKNELEHSSIWEEYKLYGIGKYKLILLKARDSNFFDNDSHFVQPIIEMLINEIKWEEFLNIDLKYFDNQKIREKSIDVDEKELHDLFYDYDTNFTHGLWGAVRESSMLICNNSSHQFHSIPDIYSNQKLPDVRSDAYRVLKMLFSLLASIYEIPDLLFEKYNFGKRI